MIEQQPKQEPVAWLDEERNIFYMHNTHKTDDYHGFKRTTPLYTEPPQREWVGFKDVADIRKIANSLRVDFSWIEFAEAIEKELKERNTCQTYQKH